MKVIIEQLSAYHLWANQSLLQTIAQLPEEKQTAPVASSFNSLYKTIVHMWSAERAWWLRLHPEKKIEKLEDLFNGSTQEAIEGLLQQDGQWNEWINLASDQTLSNAFNYSNFKGEAFSQPLYQVLVHLFNHGTYHRGQLVTMLRQLGVDKIPPTDFIVWSRRK